MCKGGPQGYPYKKIPKLNFKNIKKIIKNTYKNH